MLLPYTICQWLLNLTYVQSSKQGVHLTIEVVFWMSMCL